MGKKSKKPQAKSSSLRVQSSRKTKECDVIYSKEELDSVDDDDSPSSSDSADQPRQTKSLRANGSHRRALSVDGGVRRAVPSNHLGGTSAVAPQLSMPPKFEPAPVTIVSPRKGSAGSLGLAMPVTRVEKQRSATEIAPPPTIGAPPPLRLHSAAETSRLPTSSQRTDGASFGSGSQSARSASKKKHASVDLGHGPLRADASSLGTTALSSSTTSGSSTTASSNSTKPLKQQGLASRMAAVSHSGKVASDESTTTTERTPASRSPALDTLRGKIRPKSSAKVPAPMPAHKSMSALGVKNPFNSANSGGAGSSAKENPFKMESVTSNPFAGIANNDDNPFASLSDTDVRGATSDASSPPPPLPKKKKSTTATVSNTLSKSRTDSGGGTSMTPGDATRERKRQRIMAELVDTEAAYVNALQTITDTYLQPLKALATSATRLDKLKRIFSNIMKVKRASEAFEARLQSAAANDAVGQLFQDEFVDISVYQTYSNNYGATMDALVSLERDDATFRAALTKCDKASGDTLGSFLIKPIQRIPRYLMLLGELARNTQATHADHVALTAALAMLEEACTSLNARMADDAQHAAELRALLGDTLQGAELLAVPNRRLIKHALLSTHFRWTLPPAPLDALRDAAPKEKQRRGSALSGLRGSKSDANAKTVQRKYHFFLFNDALTFGKQKSKVVGSDVLQLSKFDAFPLALVWLKRDVAYDDAPPSDRARCFELVVPRHRFIVWCKDASERDSWLHAIAEAQKAVVTAAELGDGRRRRAQYSFPDGAIYSGQWLYGKRDGDGKSSHYGNAFDGKWRDDSRVSGTLTYMNHDQYCGAFKGDVPCGAGELLFANGDKYVGSFRGGRMHGGGELTFANGDHYKGNFECGAFDGQGTFFYAAQSVGGKKLGYSGAWRRGKFHGKGILAMHGGRRYTGQFVDGRREGDGAMLYGRGQTYTGEWRADRRHGRGTHVFVAESGVQGRYEGEWRDGVRHGAGRLESSSGDVYVGAFSEHRRHGHGRQTFALGGIVSMEGEWASDSFVKGIVEYRNGDRYEGGVRNNCAHGSGELRSGALVLRGKWEHGELCDGAKLTMSNEEDAACALGGTAECGMLVGTSAPNADEKLSGTSSGGQLQPHVLLPPRIPQPVFFSFALDDE